MIVDDYEDENKNNIPYYTKVAQVKKLRRGINTIIN